MFSKIISALRKLWGFSKRRRDCLNKAKELGLYRCAACAKLYMQKECQVDHIKPAVDIGNGFESFDRFIAGLLYAPPDNLQVLCRPCHSEKTKKEAISRAVERKTRNAKKKSSGIS